MDLRKCRRPEPGEGGKGLSLGWWKEMLILSRDGQPKSQQNRVMDESAAAPNPHSQVLEAVCRGLNPINFAVTKAHPRWAMAPGIHPSSSLSNSGFLLDHKMMEVRGFLWACCPPAFECLMKVPSSFTLTLDSPAHSSTVGNYYYYYVDPHEGNLQERRKGWF